MSHTRSIGVTEARVGLSVLTCLLVVLGYVVLQKLGGTGQTPLVETRRINIDEQVVSDPPKIEKPEQPDVIKVEGPESPVVPYTTLRPQLNAPPQ